MIVDPLPHNLDPRVNHRVCRQCVIEDDAIPHTSPLPPPQWLSPHTLIPPLNTSAGLSYLKLKNSMSFVLVQSLK